MVFDAPLPMVPSEHGNAVVQSPVFATKINPFDVGSSTTTLSAGDWPPFATVMMNEISCVGSALAGPLLLMHRSCSLTATAALEVLLVVTFSVVAVDTVEVLVMLFPAPPVTAKIARMVLVTPALIAPSEKRKAVVQS